MSIEKGDATKYVHTGNGELCYELNKALTVPETFPIYLSSAYIFDSIDPIDKICDEGAPGYAYFRLGNPNADATSQILAAGDGAEKGLVFSSGMAAITTSILATVKPGDHIVASPIIYGEAFYYLKYELKRWGVETTFIDFNTQDVADYIRPNTKLVYGETIANPALTVLDIEKFAKAAHAHGVPLIVDNTFPTPVNCRPFEWGADIVTHSTTKYMDGHGAVLGGAIVDGGKFDWMAHAEKFPGLCTPDESYHGVTYTERFGLEGAYITKATAQLMRDFGAIPAPMNAYLLNVGLETLPLRMARHCENALAVARFLKGHPKVSWVRYPGLEGDPYYERARKYLPNGTCGVVSFGVKGGREAASKFMAGLELASIATHVADAKTCVLHPASHTHRQLTDEQLMEAGVRPDLIRFSVGTEAAEDIIADLKQALEAIR